MRRITSSSSLLPELNSLPAHASCDDWNHVKTSLWPWYKLHSFAEKEANATAKLPSNDLPHHPDCSVAMHRLPPGTPHAHGPTLIFLSELGVFSYIIVEPLMSQSLSASPCSSRKGHLMDGISASMRAAAAIICTPKDTRTPPWKFSSSTSYASTWRWGGGGTRSDNTAPILPSTTWSQNIRWGPITQRRRQDTRHVVVPRKHWVSNVCLHLHCPSDIRNNSMWDFGDVALLFLKDNRLFSRLNKNVQPTQHKLPRGAEPVTSSQTRGGDAWLRLCLKPWMTSPSLSPASCPERPT